MFQEMKPLQNLINSGFDFRLTLTAYGSMWWGTSGYQNQCVPAYRDIVIECISGVPTVTSVDTAISGRYDSWSQSYYYTGWSIQSVTIKSFEILS
jgi:hypothetical protein